MKDILFGFLSKTLNMDPDRLAETLFQKSDDGSLTENLVEDALQQLLNLDASRVAALKPDTKSIFDNGYKKAEKEVSSRWESLLREKFGIQDPGIQGEALIEAAKAAPAQGGTSPDKIKASQEYLDLERRMKQALSEKEKEMSDKIAEMQSQFSKEKTWQQVSAQIRQSLQSLNPVLPSDAAKADRIIDLFMQQFKEYDFQADEREGFIPIKDGGRIEDQHGYARALADIVKERAAMMFDFKEQAPAGNAGNKNGAPVRGAKQVFKSDAEYLEAYSAAPEDQREAIYNAYMAQKNGN